MSTEKDLIYYELLVLRCRRRDPGAMEELIRHWERKLFYYVRRLLDSEEDTWDALQEIWLKVIRSIATLREPHSLPMWLYRIARNTAMSRLRKRYADQALYDDSEVLADVEQSSEQFSFEDADQVHYALGRVSLAHREVLTLYFLQDLAIIEIAEVLGLSLGTIKSRLHFGKRALRAVLEQEEATP